ncbi:TOBE domain-containing protein [Streptomyces albus]|uniref:TOBE domain-containing protein n=1 Tax=Streptomyces albus TaxID=1888 RepID=UPI003D13F2C4
MYQGRVEQLGPPAELYENPRSTFVANFLGTSNLIEAEVLPPEEGTSAGTDAGIRVKTAGADASASAGAGTGTGTGSGAGAGAGSGAGAGVGGDGEAALRLPSARCAVEGAEAGTKVLVGVRPEKISLTHADEAGTVPAGHNRLTGRITDASYLGVSWQYLVETPACPELTVYAQNVERDDRLVPGARVVLHWRPSHTFALDAAQDAAAGEEAL